MLDKIVKDVVKGAAEIVAAPVTLANELLDKIDPEPKKKKKKNNADVD